MPDYTTDPNTGILIPTPGLDPGPDYADHISDALTTLSALRHTGAANHDGLQIPSAGLDIDEDLSAQSNNLTNLRSTRYTDQASVLVGVGDLDCLYFKDGDFWLNNGDGTPVQVTSGSQLNVTEGALSYDTESVSSNHTINPSDTTILLSCNTNSGAIIITLPAANDVPVGRFYLVKDATGNSETYSVTINPDGSDTIDSESTLVLADNFISVGLISNGASNWLLFRYDRKIYRDNETIQLLDGASLFADSDSDVSVDHIEIADWAQLGGDLEIGNALIVNGNSFLNDNLEVINGIETDTLDVSGLSTLQAVTGTTIHGSTNVTAPAISASSTLTSSGSLGVGTTASVVGALTVGGAASVGSLSSTTTAAIGGAATVGGTITVTGASALNSTLGVLGAATFLSTLYTPEIHSTFGSVAYSANVVLNFAANNHLVIGNLTGNTTITCSNVSDGALYTVTSKQDGTGSRTISWSGNINFSSVFTGTPNPAGNATTIWLFLGKASGNTLYCLGAWGQ